MALTFVGIVPSAEAQSITIQARRSSDFQNSIGINLHINNEWDTAYSDAANGGTGWVGNDAATGPVLVNGRTRTNVSKIAQALLYTGIGHARVWVGANFAADRLEAVTQAVPWLKADFQTSYLSGATIAGTLGIAGNLAGMVEAFEGLNEAADNANYQGLHGAAADCRFQSELFGAVRAWNNQHGKNAPVLAPTASGQNWNDFANLASCAGSANAGNGHPYSDNQSPSQQIVYDLPYITRDAPYGAPVWATEAGYSTNPAAPRGLNEDVAAKRTLSALLGFYAHHVTRTYLYEAVDQVPQTPRLYDVGNPAEMEDHYGLFNNNWSPKESARMLHAQSLVMADNGGSAGSFAPQTMTYVVANAPGSTYSLLTQKSNGVFVLALWAEPPDMYVSATAGSWGYQRSIPTRAVTVSFDRSFSKLQTADPFTSGGDTASVKTAGQYARAVTVPLSDHVIYLILTP